MKNSLTFDGLITKGGKCKFSNCGLVIILISYSITIQLFTNLWSCIVRASATCLKKVTITHDIAQAKISNLDIKSGV